MRMRTQSLLGEHLGLVHRDVSPQHCFLTYAGEVKLLDFGLAKPSAVESATRILRGHLEYVAPEQIRCEAVDCRADVYSVGVMLWEALSGHRMWQSTASAECRQRVQAGDLPELEPGIPIPEELRLVCQKALSLDKEERFSSAAEFESALVSSCRGQVAIANQEQIESMLAQHFARQRVDARALVREQLKDERFEADSGAYRSKSAQGRSPLPVCIDPYGVGLARPGCGLLGHSTNRQTYRACGARSSTELSPSESNITFPRHWSARRSMCGFCACRAQKSLRRSGRQRRNAVTLATTRTAH